MTKNTLVIGLGNPILTDDGVGVLVAQAVQDQLRRLQADHIETAEASVGGLRLMEMMMGFDRVILIDAMISPDIPPGAHQRLCLADLAAMVPTQHSASAHDANLTTAIASGLNLGLPLPVDIVIYAVGVTNIRDFGDEPTPEVKGAIPRVTEAVLADLELPV